MGQGVQEEGASEGCVVMTQIGVEPWATSPSVKAG
jgi:hypothetical protein